MKQDIIALLLWSALALSVVLTIVGVIVREPALVFVAAAMSFAFGIIALFSIGAVVLVGTIVQLSLAFAIRRRHQIPNAS